MRKIGKRHSGTKNIKFVAEPLLFVSLQNETKTKSNVNLHNSIIKRNAITLHRKTEERN